MSAEKKSDVERLIPQLIASAQQGNIRISCWLTGSEAWSASQIKRLIHASDISRYSIITSRQWPGLNTCPVHQTHRLLGQEMELLIYDGFSGVNPDTLGQISGLVKGGGLLLFLTPPPELPEFFNDPEKQRLLVEPYTPSDVGNYFLEYVKRCFTEEPSLLRFDQQQGFTSELPTSLECASTSTSSALSDQQKVINQISRHLASSGQQCCVLTAARGRGKSSALGIIARRLMKAGQSVVVTAPRSDAVESLFYHAANEAGFERTRYQVSSKNAQLVFQRPVDVCKEDSRADILLVDEAAGIPVHLLSSYLDHYPKIIFATTTQGYEGTGQGFALRFLSILRQRISSLACLTLDKPVRWSEHDPLEPFFNKLLLLDAVVPAKPKVTSLSSVIGYRPVNSEWLLAHPDKLRALFGLMIEAHYRTTPGDLRIMLDSPNLKIWIAESEEQIVGACLVAEEGGLDDALVQRIWEGRRRPRGHLIPQLLIAQEGYMEAAALKVLRVVRIAVSDENRRHGVARGLLDHIQQHAVKHQQSDLIGASFAVTPELLDFWQSQGFQVVRIGTQLDPVSGAHAALVLKGLSVTAEQALSIWSSEFQRRFYYLQREWLSCLEEDILQRIQSALFDTIQNNKVQVGKIGQKRRAEYFDWRDLSGFAFHFRAYESSAFVFSELAKRYSSLWDLPATDKQLKYLIEARVIQQRSEQEVMQQCHFPNGKVLIQALRSAAAFLYTQAQQAGVAL